MKLLRLSPFRRSTLVLVAVAHLSLSPAAPGFFGSPTTVTLAGAGSNPRSVAVGDLDGDGKPDIVTASLDSNSVVVLLGTGGGGFRLAASYAVGDGPVAALLEDVNRDGLLDAVVANYRGKSLSVLFGDGEGGFHPAPYSPIVLTGPPSALRFADLDGDGRKDLVVALTGSVAVVSATSAGFASPTVPISFASHFEPTDLQVADVNRDGRLDVLVLDYGFGVLTFVRTGSGSFSLLAPSGINFGAGKAAVGDLNGDGRPDVVFAGFRDTHQVKSYLGSANGPFSLVPGTTLSGFNGVALGDLDGDGRLDLVTAFGSLVTVYRGLGNGSFTETSPATAFEVPDEVTGFAIADVSGDGRPDIVTSSYTGFVSVHLGGSFAPAPGSPFQIAFAPIGGLVADVNGDGRADIVTVNDGRTLSVLLADASGATRAPGALYFLPRNATSVQAVDVNGDGKIDLAATSSDYFAPTFLIGDGHGGFVPATGTLPPGIRGDSQHMSRYVDVDGDGRIDILHAITRDSWIDVYRGNGDGSFQSPLRTDVGGWVADLAITDFDRDGLADVVVAREYPQRDVVVFRGDGAGHFVEGASTKAYVPFFDFLRVGDLDGDGFPDLLLLSPGNNRIEPYFGNGLALAAGPMSTGVDPYETRHGTTLVDVDGDGFPDVVYSLGSAIVVFLNDGAGRFRRAPGSPFALGSIRPAFGDLNGDGFVDAVAFAAPPGALTIHPQVRLAISPFTLRDVAAGSPVSQQLTASGGLPPYSFAVTRGALPHGLALSANGVVSGLPAARGTSVFTITATDGNGVLGTRPYTIAVGSTAATSTVSLATSPNPSAAGQTVTFTATVTGPGATPSGTVTFLDGPTTLATVPLSGGSASFARMLEAGTHGLSALYSGDAVHRPARSSPSAHTVKSSLRAPTLTLASSSDTVTAGQPFTLRVTISSDVGIPSGPILFRDGSALLGTALPDATGAARIDTALPAPGLHLLSASSAGDAAFDPATSSPLFQTVKTRGGCDAGADDTLCVFGGRFRIQVDWRNPYSPAPTARATARALTENAGVFWFFDSGNLELIVKALDGRGVNGSFWIGFGALSDVEYTITVLDGETGRSRSYYNPPRKLGGYLDINAFPTSGRPDTGQVALPDLPGAPATVYGETIWPLPRSVAAPAGTATWTVTSRSPLAGCASGSESLCLASRFLVAVEWKDPYGGSSGAGKALPLTTDTGAFWFFDPGNIELMVKVLDGRPINGRYWVLYGALSDVEYTITVTDTESGKVNSYYNPPRKLGSGIDTAAF